MPDHPAPANQPDDVILFSSPNAGSGAGRAELPRLISRLRAENIRVETITSVEGLRQSVCDRPSGPSLTNASSTNASLTGSRPPVVVAAGGDGTIGLVAKTIGDAAPIVPMPLGTENLLSKHFGFLASADAVYDTIVRGREQRMDVGTVNDKPFLVMATCGFDAEVVRAMHLTRRGHIQRWSYVRPIMRALRRYRFPILDVRLDGDRVISGGWAMVFNVPRYAASLAIEPDAIPSDGLLDVIVFQGRSIRRSIAYLAGIASGHHVHFSDVVRVQASTIEIASQDKRERVPFQTDGDYAGRLPARIEVLPGHVWLRLPKTSPQRDH